MPRSSPEEMREELEPILKKLFSLMDADSSGEIGAAEGCAVGRCMQPSDPEGWWKSLLKHADTDESDTVDMEEYIEYVVKAYVMIGADAPAANMELMMVYDKLETGLAKQTVQKLRGYEPDDDAS
jgi:Ca2+-binding EF-hand superfamily protein